MTLEEYHYMFRAYQLKRVDYERDMYLQAWLNVQAEATKEQGKKVVPVYRTFKDFFDYDKRIREITRPADKPLPDNMKRLAKIGKWANTGKEG